MVYVFAVQFFCVWVNTGFNFDIPAEMLQFCCAFLICTYSRSYLLYEIKQVNLFSCGCLICLI